MLTGCRWQYSLIRALCGAAIATALSPALVAQPAAFHGLGRLPGALYSEAHAISVDGTTVVGRSGDWFSDQAFRWNATTGIAGLGSTPQTWALSATGVSADGSVVVGVGSVISGPLQAFRWTQSSGIVLEDIASSGYDFYWNASVAVSADGDALVGTVAHAANTRCPGDKPGGGGHPDLRAFRQAHAGGNAHRLAPLAGYDNSLGTGVSSDGSIIVGNSLNWCGGPFGTQLYQGCIWIGGGNASPVAIGPAGSTLAGVSSDGSAAVGSLYGTAFRWTAAAGVLNLGAGQAYATSADGSVVAGMSLGVAFIWDEAHGIRDLRTVLVRLGLDLTGWTLLSANGLSGDGLTIVGTGTNPAGQLEAWIAHLGDALPPCPGDVNDDGAVDLGDLAILLAHFGAASGATLHDGDLDADSDVDLGDLSALLANFGTTCP